MSRERSSRGLFRVTAVIALCFGAGLAAARTAGAAAPAQLEQLEIDLVRAEDVRAIRKLQRAYGYYADRGLWNELADLFTDDAVANYPSGGFDGKASVHAMFLQNLGAGKPGLAEGRIYNHTILQPVVDLSADGATATGRWRVLGMLGRYGGSATWADSLYRFDYVKQNGRWKIRTLTAYAGSGGGYENGWVQPKPRPPGAIDTSPVRFNLAHPADRPWLDPCEADVSVCVVPFPYPNRGGLRAPEQRSAWVGPTAAAPAAHAADLVRRARRLADEDAVLNLQRAYGYYVDRGWWKQAAALFTPDGRREEGQGGVYLGRDHIRQVLALAGPQGLRDGQLNDRLQLEPIVHVAADGRTARGRIFELAFIGGAGEPARIVQSVAENEYEKRGGRWMIRSEHLYTILVTDYAQGWAKSALPAPAPVAAPPPDRAPTVVYEAYPKVFLPPLHFDPDSIGVASAPADVSSAKVPSRRALAEAEARVQRAADRDAIENLQGAYGYYAEKSLWSDLAALFASDGAMVAVDETFKGPERILARLRASRPEGPVKGALNSQLHLQPVIHVAADGRTAKIRARVLQLSRDAEGRPQWGAGIYENDLVKEEGVWKYARVRFHRSWLVDYRRGWTMPVDGEGQVLPSHDTLPFHYGSVP